MKLQTMFISKTFNTEIMVNTVNHFIHLLAKQTKTIE